MMTTGKLSGFSAVAVLRTGPNNIGRNLRSFFFKPLLTSTSASSTLKTTSAGKLLASSTIAGVTEPDSISDVQGFSTSKNILACPICYVPLIWNGDPVLSVDAAPRSSLRCGTCKKSYFGNETHLDLTVASGAKEYGEAMPASTEIFRFLDDVVCELTGVGTTTTICGRTPLVSFLYERGWRQSFSIWGGFPGPEEEFELTKGYLKPVLGGNIVDASCGSGLFSRLFAKSGLFSLVVALDFSENMLRQCYEFIKQEENFPKENFILVRADISRLPFPSRSIDAVHAGAAIHCWPSPSAAVAEISRVLRPGGVFVATTYILDGPYSALPLLRPLRQNIGQISGSHIFLDECELKDLCDACGLVGFTCTRDRRFVMISASKPS